MNMRRPYTVCLLIWVAKLEMSRVLQSNKNKTWRGRCYHLSVSMEVLFRGAFEWKEMIGPSGKLLC